MAEKLVYFLSDAHLGSKAIKDTRAHERRLVSFLDSIKDKASAIYLLGDMFDFWFEYRTVVPKGHVRFLGKIAELADSGVEIHFFTGNHDMWTFGYLADELGINVHTKPETTDILGKTFFLAHGDGLNDDKLSVRIIQGIFHSKLLQFLFRLLPPFIGLNFGYAWSKSNRLKHDNEDCGYMGEENEPLVLFAKKHSETHDVDFYLFGHRHILLDLPIGRSRVLVLGDWFNEFSYATFDGNELLIHHFE
ncbi:MAG: UDP-2,3-diacylglucosamine diphosphatase [Paludibacteraceae bacterium]|nr:UDP-2,3-diacylglucosamine diphosphatase [Paludibacteraceae bacterium]MBP5136874.1 UDP-2,3-diacylglucosamine diphosphatase [Paludibacteraceae bacterium]